MVCRGSRHLYHDNIFAYIDDIRRFNCRHVNDDMNANYPEGRTMMIDADKLVNVHSAGYVHVACPSYMSHTVITTIISLRYMPSLHMAVQAGSLRNGQSFF